MSLRELIEPDCGGANPLMRLGSHMRRDAAYKDEGLSQGAGPSFVNSRQQQLGPDHLVHDFLGTIAAPPQTFRMDALLQEMREIDAHNFHGRVQQAPAIIEEITNDNAWANQFAKESTAKAKPQDGYNQMLSINENNRTVKANPVWNRPLPFHQLHRHQPYYPSPQMSRVNAAFNLENEKYAQDFFDVCEAAQKNQIPLAANEIVGAVADDPDQHKYSEFMKFMNNVSDGSVKIEDGQVFNQTQSPKAGVLDSSEDWANDFNMSKQAEVDATENYNTQFWNRLQDEWKKISEEDDKQHPWLSEFSEYYDPYKEYTFDEENPMTDMENAFEKGKIFLAQGDIPSAVSCFESAVKQDPTNAEIWELLGTSQAENEKDPNAIAALKKSLELNPNNPKVLMALAVSYTNESLQNQALNMLVSWLKSNQEYAHLLPADLISNDSSGDGAAAAMVSSMVRGTDLKEVQELFLKMVQHKHPAIDADIQEALGVLFNLSSEYDKAADCFRAALHVRPENAKTWNRLGASYANGNHSVEAVDAYQHALEIQPGFIRARYNVGISCINLKAYKEAAEHFLTALNHQATSMTRSGLDKQNPANQMSDTIWGTLRMAISLMGRIDLQPSIDERNLTALNAAFETI